MFTFAKIRAAVSGGASKFSGKLDFLQACCAAAALIAIADGDVEEKEVEKTTELLAAHPQLSTFSNSGLVFETMIARAKVGITGRVGLYKELDDIASDKEMCETVYLTALDVAMSDGQIEPQEQEVLKKIAARLGIDPKKYDV